MPQTCESPRVISLSSLHISSSLKNGICFPLNSLQTVYFFLSPPLCSVHHHLFPRLFSQPFKLSVYFQPCPLPFSSASKHSEYPEFQIWQSINKILQKLPMPGVQEQSLNSLTQFMIASSFGVYLILQPYVF